MAQRILWMLGAPVGLDGRSVTLVHCHDIYICWVMCFLSRFATVYAIGTWAPSDIGTDDGSPSPQRVPTRVLLHGIEARTVFPRPGESIPVSLRNRLCPRILLHGLDARSVCPCSHSLPRSGCPRPRIRHDCIRCAAAPNESRPRLIPRGESRSQRLIVHARALPWNESWLWLDGHCLRNDLPKMRRRRSILAWGWFRHPYWNQRGTKVAGVPRKCQGVPQPMKQWGS